jgi:hypothetical protein
MRFSSLKRATLAWVFFLSGLAMLAGARGAEPQAAANENINPHGRPKSFAVGKVTEYAVWFADDAWHIRASTVAGTRGLFHGFVHVDGGEIVDGSFADLELAHHKRAGSDWLVVDSDKKGFEFLFRTAGHMDGLNFKCSEAAKNLKFSLLLETDTNPNHIVLGADDTHPATNPFILPAHPTKEHANKGEKKKKSNE